MTKTFLEYFCFKHAEVYSSSVMNISSLVCVLLRLKLTQTSRHSIQRLTTIHDIWSLVFGSWSWFFSGIVTHGSRACGISAIGNSIRWPSVRRAFQPLCWRFSQTHSSTGSSDASVKHWISWNWTSSRISNWLRHDVKTVFRKTWNNAESLVLLSLVSIGIIWPQDCVCVCESIKDLVRTCQCQLCVMRSLIIIQVQKWVWKW